MLNRLRKVDPKIYEAVRNEVRRQQVNLELIASENFVSQAVLEAMGSVLTNKYAEGYPGARYYCGCEWVDVCENLAIERAKEIFGYDHANVQPHSGTQANMAAYMALLQTGDTILAMDLTQGGHLSHGYGKNFSGQYYRAVNYGVNPETGRIDMDEVGKLAEEHKPKIIVAGASAYPREIDFAAFGEVAKGVGALLMADLAHIAGLVAAGLHPSPQGHAQVTTTTTHKTMRGPRGAIALCDKKYAKKMDSAVFPGLQGGPLEHVIAAKAVALKEALSPGFKSYQKRIVDNAKALAAGLEKRGYDLVTGGTDNHMILVDLRGKGITGKDASSALERAGLTTNKNAVPNDPKPPAVTSGIRLGTPAVTTRRMGPEEMDLIAELIDRVLGAPNDRRVRKYVREQTLDLCDTFPIYSGLLRRLYEQDRDAYEVDAGTFASDL
ncbi:MAG: serine hydroxymethyltransferase [Planctomycetota bacterium]